MLHTKPGGEPLDTACAQRSVQSGPVMQNAVRFVHPHAANLCGHGPHLTGAAAEHAPARLDWHAARQARFARCAHLEEVAGGDGLDRQEGPAAHPEGAPADARDRQARGVGCRRGGIDRGGIGRGCFGSGRIGDEARQAAVGGVCGLGRRLRAGAGPRERGSCSAVRALLYKVPQKAWLCTPVRPGPAGPASPYNAR